MRKLFSNIIYILFLVANSCYIPTVHADAWFYGFGPALNLLYRDGHFSDINENAFLSATPQGSTLHAMANLLGGYQWAITPQFFLGAETLSELSFSRSSSTIRGSSKGDSLSITTTQRYIGGYGFLIQPGVYSRRFNALAFFDIGLIRGRFHTHYHESIHSNGNYLINKIATTRWKNGLRLGVSHEVPISGWPGAFGRLDVTFTHFTPWKMQSAKSQLIAMERPTSMQIIWNIVWHLDSGSHLVSDIVLHHGVLHYLIHPNDFGYESKDISKSPF